jgi:hypothetical protein
MIQMLDEMNMRLVDRQTFDIKMQLRICRDAFLSLLAVRKIGWNSKTTLAASGHARDTDVPSFNDFANAELEFEGLPFGVCYM